MQPFGDRSKVVIEPMLTDQWFVDTDKIVGPALDRVRDGTVRIIPESGERTYYHWLENIEPWCISRQLWWGHQIPVWYGLNLTGDGSYDDEGDGAMDPVEMGRFLMDQRLAPGDEHAHCAPDFESVKDRFYDDEAALPNPLNHATVVEVADRAEAIHKLAQSLADYEGHQDPTRLVYPVWRDADVLDTWFSSGLWPIGTLGWPEDTEELRKYFPTSVLVTGQDILFFWVARMMMMQLAVVNQVPFDTVYLHGLVRDAKGKKMSKSLGNVVDPLEIIDEYGADALRFASAAMAALGGVLKLDMQRIAGYRNFGTKLWNAAAYGEMRGTLRDPPRRRGSGHASWRSTAGSRGRSPKTREAVDAALTDFRFNDAADALYTFVWGVFCDWYLEFTKPVFDGEDAEAIEETKRTYAWALDQCLILLHPIMPFITEELWGRKDRPKHLIHADWPIYTVAEMVDAGADAELNWVVRLIEQTRSARQQMHVPAGAHVPMVVTGFTDTARAAFTANEAMILRLARVEGLSEVEAFPKGTVTLNVPGGQFGLPLADIIDVEAEKARLEKTLGKLAKEIGGLEGRLNNPKFVESAPEDVVEETRTNLEERRDEQEKLREAMARLAELQ